MTCLPCLARPTPALKWEGPALKPPKRMDYYIHLKYVCPNLNLMLNLNMVQSQFKLPFKYDHTAGMDFCRRGAD